jgi:hypothetical protein
MSDASVPEPSVVATRKGRIGHLLLNRPKALNALDLDMIRRMRAALDNWRDDPEIHAVLVEGAGGRAFSAGGDVISVRAHGMAGNPGPIESFFGEEYALNASIAEYPHRYELRQRALTGPIRREVDRVSRLRFAHRRGKRTPDSGRRIRATHHVRPKVKLLCHRVDAVPVHVDEVHVVVPSLLNQLAENVVVLLVYRMVRLWSRSKCQHVLRP